MCASSKGINDPKLLVILVPIDSIGGFSQNVCQRRPVNVMGAAVASNIPLKFLNQIATHLVSRKLYAVCVCTLHAMKTHSCVFIWHLLLIQYTVRGKFLRGKILVNNLVIGMQFAKFSSPRYINTVE